MERHEEIKNNAPTPKQLAWRARVKLLWKLKSIHLNTSGVSLTQEEKQRLEGINIIINNIVKDFTSNSITLGFNAVNRCYYCGKPASYIDTRGCYICAEHLEQYKELQ